MRVLFTTIFSDDLGCPASILPIATEMARRGHTVAFCNPRRAPTQLISDACLINIPYSGPKPSLFPPATKDIWDMDHLAAQFGFMDEAFVRATCRSLIGLINDYRADLVVDLWNLGVCMATRILRKPLVTILHADLHPASRGFIWWKERPADVPSPVHALNVVLAENDLPQVETSSELLVGDLTLISGTPESDPLPADAEVTYIGPMLWQSPEAKLPEWITSLNGGKPLVWLYTGNPRYGSSPTVGDSNVVLQASIAALKDEDVHVVLTTGYQPLPDSTPSLPSHFYFTPYVPGLEMARRSNLLIHHGGHGSCLTGLATGTPAFIIPTFSERESNARRIAALGAGDFLVPEEDSSGEKLLSPDELHDGLKRVLSDAAFTINAERISGTMNQYGRAPLAVELIEELCS